MAAAPEALLPSQPCSSISNPESASVRPIMPSLRILHSSAISGRSMQILLGMHIRSPVRSVPARSQNCPVSISTRKPGLNAADIRYILGVWNGCETSLIGVWSSITWMDLRFDTSQLYGIDRGLWYCSCTIRSYFLLLFYCLYFIIIIIILIYITYKNIVLQLEITKAKGRKGDFQDNWLFRFIQENSSCI